MRTILFLCLWLPLQPLLAQNDLVPDIAVAANEQHVVINVPQLRLFVFENGELSNAYPVAVGKKHTKTPPGEYTIRYKAYKPTWSIPVSIQKERARKGKPHITSIAPGPSNPLGPVFVRFGDPKLGLGIHGTNAPASVPGVRSHGCVRMKNQDVLQFAKNIENDTVVSVIYQTLALNEDEAGQLWFSAYPDPYHQEGKSLQKLISVALDWFAHQKIAVDEITLTQTIQQNSRKRTSKKNRPVCLSCTADKPTIQGELHALAWTDGSADIRGLLFPHGEDERLPEAIQYDIHKGKMIIDFTKPAPTTKNTETPWFLSPDVKSTSNQTTH